MGKIYLMYLVIAMVAVLHGTSSACSGTRRRRLQRRPRPIFVALSFADPDRAAGRVLAGCLQRHHGVSWMVASAVPLFVAGVVIAGDGAGARDDLSDPHRPGRAAGDLLLVGVAHASPGHSCSRWRCCPRCCPCSGPGAEARRERSAFYVLVGGGGLLLPCEPARQPRDQALHRPELLRQPLRLPARVGASERRDRADRRGTEDIVRQIDALVRAVFDAERVGDLPACARNRRRSRPRASAPQMPMHDRARQHARVGLVRAARARRSRSARRRSTSSLCPRRPRTDEAIQAMSAAVCAPLRWPATCSSGMLWLSEKRNERGRTRREDVEFLTAMSRPARGDACGSRQLAGAAGADAAARVAPPSVDATCSMTSRTRCRACRSWSRTRAGTSRTRNSSATRWRWSSAP